MEVIDKCVKKDSAKKRQKSSKEITLYCQNCLVESSGEVVKSFSNYKTSDSKLLCPWCLSYKLREIAGGNR